MSETARLRANRAQADASDPDVSAFVAASAGSGKTKLLTDRLLRLMLGGAAPERIQCLTFTKAAAAEMALRLQRVLGRWVTLPEPDLARALDALGVDPAPDALATARALFARVLDLPGGMRIGTIHAFSQSLLRRFPLEAAISPHFQLVDDRDADEALTDAREGMLARASGAGQLAALRALAGLTSADDFGKLVKALQSDRERLSAALALGDGLAAAQRRVLGVQAADEPSLLTEAVAWMGESVLRDAATAVAANGSPAVQERARAILDWLSLDDQKRAAHWTDWCGLFLNASAEARGPTTLVNKVLAAKRPDLLDRYLEEAHRILRIEDQRKALRLADVSNALAVLAGPVAAAYAARKAESGLLDYDDLIDGTLRLLQDPGAAWVLYKLDGGLDHILLDEVQDTAPSQWHIAHRLTEEFFAGAGARDTTRTVFAVGDRKQSIYSFQGADTAEFDRSRDTLEKRVLRAGQVFRDVTLDVSFRSTAPVLALVDAVFAGPLAAPGVVAPGETLTHYPDRAGHAGLVEVWPLAPPPPAADAEPWTVPDRNQSQESARGVLANALADWIAAQTNGSVPLQSKARPLAPGDVLILVRRRDAFSRALVRALKARGVPVAGLDRMVLTDQPAVQDLMALCDALLLPSDDLALACVLTSPLGGLTDDELADLAMERPGTLYEALRARAEQRPSCRRAADFFAALLARADFVSPYALLSEALGPLGARARLFARLGPEAAEPVDELLNAALTYAARHPPSLQGFLRWLRRSAAEVKREAEAAGGLVRIMTVHGAKGLQAPLVILPDTAAMPKEDNGVFWAHDQATGREVPLWAPRREYRCNALDALRQDERRQKLEEHNRLLYVALTRAEDRLLVCGWQGRSAPKDECWHSLVRAGFEALGATPEPFAAWPGTAMAWYSEQRAEPEPLGSVPAAAVAQAAPAWIGTAPDWAPAPPPSEPPRPVPLAPSRPEGADMGDIPPAESPLRAAPDRFRRGQLVHTLLQHLPALPPDQREPAALRYLADNGEPARAIAAEVLAVMAHPDLAPLFAPGSRAEVPLTGVVADQVVGGLVDRLAVLADRVLVADFKTNRYPPGRAEDTPVLYLRQMAAYRAVLRAIFPGRHVRCALVWTRSATVSVLADDILDPHDPGYARGAA